MKFLWLAALLSLTHAQPHPQKSQIESAFLHFDLNKDGTVTKGELMESLMKDLELQNYSDDIQRMVEAIDEMTSRHDKNQDGLDFMEMYMASGGKLHDL